MCCTGGVSKDNPNAPEDNTDVWLMIFFRDHFGTFINKLATKIVVLLIWAAYLGVGIWGCTQLKQGLDLKKLAPDGSYVTGFYDQRDTYFTHYRSMVQVVVHSTIDSKEKVNEIEKLLTELENTKHIHGSTFTQSWLRDYQKYATSKGFSISYDNIFDSNFNSFLQEPAYDYSNDIIKVGNENKIFRFLVMSKDITDTTTEIAMMKDVRRVADKYANLDITVFSPMFIYTEQYVGILPNTLQNLGIATCSMLIISLLLIPHPVVSLWVTVSIVSICVGVVGYMALWDVHMDTISMINIIMCIGFCVDFTAHITYAFVSSQMIERSDRVRDALYNLGMPILQGSMSTILAVVVLAASFSYIFRTFFKVMFLVILFGSLHGMFLLPVILSIIGPKGSENDVEDSHTIGNENPAFEAKESPDKDKVPANSVSGKDTLEKDPNV